MGEGDKIENCDIIELRLINKNLRIINGLKEK